MITCWPQAHRPQTGWNQKVDNEDSWNITLLPHHQPIRLMFMSWSLLGAPYKPPLNVALKKNLAWKALSHPGLSSITPILLTWCLANWCCTWLHHNLMSRLPLLSWAHRPKFSLVTRGSRLEAALGRAGRGGGSCWRGKSRPRGKCQKAARRRSEDE